MRITVTLSALSRTRWYEYLYRFIFGGAITALAGVIAKKYGPSVGGLFLAFPAIFPAGATLIEKHEKEKKNQAGVRGTVRGRKAAALDAAGAGIGAFGLLTFAFLVWKLIADLSAWAALSSATVAWLSVSVLVWKLWRVL
jgi:hypothetical protein